MTCRQSMLTGYITSPCTARKLTVDIRQQLAYIVNCDQKL
jgi:hypothetical protein